MPHTFLKKTSQCAVMVSSPSTINPKDFRVTLVGAGALGTALARTLHDAGYKFRCIINRTRTGAERLAATLGNVKASDSLADIPLDTNLLLLAVNDSSLADVAHSLSFSKLGFSRLTVVHFSGALTTDVLAPLAAKEAITIALHPFQTFDAPEKSVGNPFKCYFGLQAGELEGVELGKRLAHDLGGRVMVVPKEAKTLYHASAVFASNYLVTLTSIASEILAALGLTHKDAIKVFEPIMLQTIENMKRADDAPDALSGPIERGDAATLKKHLTELAEQMPHLVPVYSALAIETVRVAIHKGSISQQQASALLTLLEEFTRRESSA
jgi:predicted short-subunit dehydrogenase-like oxidoreductase (DUF2520 family)